MNPEKMNSPIPEEKPGENLADTYEEEKKAYEEEANNLWNDGWRGSTEDPNSPTMSGSPELEKNAIDLDTGEPLPDGTKQTAIHVLNHPVGWGDRGWFVKEGVQPAPGPGYKVFIREAKDGKWTGGPSEQE